MIGGVLQVASEGELQQREKEQAHSNALPAELAPALVTHVKSRWEDARIAKQDITKRLLDCQQRRNSQYGDQKLAEIRKAGGSEIYMSITSIKCRGAAAWIKDILLPASDKAWGIDPTTKPEDADVARRMAEETISQDVQQFIQQTGQMVSQEEVTDAVDKVAASFEADALEAAKEAMEKMESLIEDQLEEGGWQAATEESIDDFVTYPTAFMRKSLVRRRKQIEWVQGQAGWHPEVVEKEVEEWERISPFDCYPAPGAKDIDSSPFIQKHRFTQSQLRNMIGAYGYDSEAIKRVLLRYRTGLEDHSQDEYARRQAENKPRINLYKTETIDGLELWDNVSGEMLMEWDAGKGLLGDLDPYEDYSVSIIYIADEVISAEINSDPLGRKPFGKASFENVPGSIWGIALPELFKHDQDMCNSAARSLENNMGLSSGPQVAYDVSALPVGYKVGSLYPWKTHQFDGAKTNGRSPISFFQPQSNAAELMGIYEKFAVQADEHSGVPRYAYGDSRASGAGRTASGLSMLMSNASKGIKSAIGHYDRGIIKYLITLQYNWNMIYHPDQSVKGDATVVARGASALLHKEIQQQRRAELLAATNNPTDLQIIGVEGRAELLRETFKASELGDIVPSEQELRNRMEQQAQQQAQAQGQQGGPALAPPQ